jgi:RHS repeat-associated protein
VGNYYEVTAGVVTKYYYAGSQRIAVRKNGVLNYLLSDHLGSTSLVTDAAGVVVSQQQYKAWGETRYTSGSEVTRYQYTGQYSDSYINLLDYGSRRYDPELGRFIQPDSIVPVASQGTQAYDRYGYVNNNPVRYTDPTGHCIFDPIEAILCGAIAYTATALYVGVRTMAAKPDGNNASNIWELMKQGVEQADHVNITGEGLQSLKDDPSAISMDIFG